MVLVQDKAKLPIYGLYAKGRGQLCLLSFIGLSWYVRTPSMLGATVQFRLQA